MNREAWSSLFPAERGVDMVFTDVERRYAEEWRRYHVAEHVNECLTLLDENRDLAINPDGIAAAIFFHDAVYIPGASDNEDRSAELAHRSLLALGWDDERARAVAELVSSTDHLSGRLRDDCLNDRSDRNLLHDIDLAVLGAPPERYARYARDVRAEHATVPDDDYARGRTRVIERFLGSASIYILPRFVLRFESDARRNLAAELESLSATQDRHASSDMR